MAVGDTLTLPWFVPPDPPILGGWEARHFNRAPPALAIIQPMRTIVRSDVVAEQAYQGAGTLVPVGVVRGTLMQKWPFAA